MPKVGLPFAPSVAAAMSQVRAGRVATLGGTARVGHAVPFRERDRAAVGGDGRTAGHRRAQVEEVGVAAADALVLEVAVNDRELEAVPRARRAGLGVGAHLRRAGEARLFLALIVAAVALREVAVVALFARLDVAVAAARVAGTRRRAVAALRLLDAALRAAGAVAEEQAVALERARDAVTLVARLAGLDLLVAAHRRDALAGHHRVVAGRARLHRRTSGSSRRPPSCSRRRTLRRR